MRPFFYAHAKGRRQLGRWQSRWLCSVRRHRRSPRPKRAQSSALQATTGGSSRRTIASGVFLSSGRDMTYGPAGAPPTVLHRAAQAASKAIVVVNDQHVQRRRCKKFRHLHRYLDSKAASDFLECGKLRTQLRARPRRRAGSSEALLRSRPRSHRRRRRRESAHARRLRTHRWCVQLYTSRRNSASG